MKYTQKDKRIIGKKIEYFIAKLFKGKVVKEGELIGKELKETKYYDVETKNLLIEVKSCRVINKLKRGHQIGRFQIKTNSHVGLHLEAQQKNKRPVYAFVLRVNNHKIFKLVNWDKIEVDYKRKYTYIPWVDIFGI